MHTYVSGVEVIVCLILLRHAPSLKLDLAWQPQTQQSSCPTSHCAVVTGACGLSRLLSGSGDLNSDPYICMEALLPPEPSLQFLLSICLIFTWAHFSNGSATDKWEIMSFFLGFKRKFIFNYVFNCVGPFMWVQVLLEGRGVRFPAAAVTGCELCQVSAGNWTLFFCQNTASS